MAHSVPGSKVPDLSKQLTISAWVALTDMRKWLLGVVGFCLFLLLLLRYKVLERPSAWSYLDIPTNYSSVPLNAQYEKVNNQLTLPTEKVDRIVSSILFLGLDNRTGLVNISSLTSELIIVSLWRHLEPVFHHSRLFPEAKKGLKEAEVAWKELLEERKLDPLAKKNNSTKEMAEKQCPYSVSYINSTHSVDRDNLAVSIPCGLVVDSSITLIGVPQGAEGDFAIELLGPKLPGEPDAPIVLHYNVRLQGDEVTDKAVIVQNTWNHGWADEERCPSPEKDDQRKVDGLNVCAEQVGKSAVRKLSNLKESIAANWPATLLKGENKPWFPFVNRFPFAATLWVGWEGFHMTVNGKHATSFEYRQNLEPSLVNGVTLKGSLMPISMIANGLPTSEDITQISDLEFLKAPPWSSKTKKELFIGVFSTGNNFDRRMAVRRSWMQYEAVRSGAVVVRFFVGLHNNKQVNKELWREATTYGDIQLMPFVDYYNLISLKTIAICVFGTKMVTSKYIMKTDDDTFVRVDEVLSSLNRTKHTRGLLYGSLEFDARPHRDPDSKWFISNEEWSGSFYPPYALGPGYIVTRDIAKSVVLTHERRKLKLFKLEDVSMGMWIDEYKNQGHKIHYSHDGRFINTGCKEGYVIAHYQNPRNMVCLWQKLIKGSGPVCCE